jgi:predicted metal-dependent enzyme (double-stranded beta helix superfamily)
MKMESERYSIADLAVDLRQLCAKCDDERLILSRLCPLARRAAQCKSAWFERRLYAADEAQGFGVHLLHEEPDHNLTIFAVSWLPHRGAPPHDHGTWAVVAGVEGREKNRFFARTDEGTRRGYAELEPVGERDCGEGDVLTMPRGTIHSVCNETDAVSVSLHIYGRHINHTSRSQFDLERKIATAFVVTMADAEVASKRGLSS